MKGNPEVDALVADYAKCATADELGQFEKRRSEIWKAAKAADKQRLKEASEAAQRRLAPIDQAALIVSLTGATDLEQLERAWEAIQNSLAMVPLDIETVYQDCKTALERA